MPTRMIRVRLRRLARNILHARGSPEQIAFGFALGTFIAFTPTMGIQIFIAAIVATIFNASRIPAVIAVFITNYVTAVPLFAFCYKVGVWVLRPFVPGIGDQWNKLQQVFESEGAGSWLERAFHHVVALMKFSWGMMGPLWVGGCIVGLVCGAVTYPIVLRLVKGHMVVMAQRRARRWQKRAEKQHEEHAVPPAPPKEAPPA